jgi:hypothetical protein
LHDKAASRVKLSLRDAEAVHLPVHQGLAPTSSTFYLVLVVILLS